MFAIGADPLVSEFHVLPGDQSRQRYRLRGLRSEFLLGQVTEQPVGVADKGIYELGAGLFIVPRDRRFTRIVVVMRAAMLTHHRGRPGDPADRRDH